MNTPDTLPLPARLRAWRASVAMTQSAAARQLGISVDTLRGWEQGRHTPNAAALSLIERVITEQQTKPQ